MALLLINFIGGFIDPENWNFYVLTILNHTMFLNPLINLIFLIMMIRRLNDLLGIKVTFCRKLLGAKSREE
jgi:hypothetical protein